MIYLHPTLPALHTFLMIACFCFVTTPVFADAGAEKQPMSDTKGVETVKGEVPQESQPAPTSEEGEEGQPPTAVPPVQPRPLQAEDLGDDFELVLPGKSSVQPGIQPLQEPGRYLDGTMSEENLAVADVYARDGYEGVRVLAEQGISGAQFVVGLSYQFGIFDVPKDLEKAFYWYRLAANQGDPGAQRNLGTMYFRGEGVPQDYKEALRWYRLAAEEGDVDAQQKLGNMFYFGDGVSQDYEEATKWYHLAAEAGDVYSQTQVGVAYWFGWGVSKDFEKALHWARLAAEQGSALAQWMMGYLIGEKNDWVESARWYRLAAEQGHAGGQALLGSLYYHGKGVPQNYTEAVKWALLAAEQGHFLGQRQLGILYFLGKGVPQDDVQAHMWFNLAAAQNDEKSVELREMVSQVMTRDQIAEAQRLAREWLEQHQK